MLERLTDKQIETSIKTIIVLIVIAVLAVGANYVYQKYSSTDVKATDIIDKALSKVKSQPRSERARTELADLLVGQNRLEEALKQYGQAIKLNEKYGPALIGMGVAYQKNGDEQKAIASFEKEISVASSGQNAAIDKNLEKAYFYKGKILLDKGSHKEAVKSFKNALKIEPSMSDTHYLLGKAQKESGQKQEAITSFKKALKLNPSLRAAKKGLEDLGG